LVLFHQLEALLLGLSFGSPLAQFETERQAKPSPWQPESDPLIDTTSKQTIKVALVKLVIEGGK
jgi:hypothetical protein